MHEPVLLLEVIEELHIQNQARYIDATLGAAGHTIEIINRGGKVLGLDQDMMMLEVAKKRVTEACPVTIYNRDLFTPVHANFHQLEQIARNHGFKPVEGILFDLGVSSLHFSSEDRGFSFQFPEASLDMRLDPQTSAVTAAALLNGLREDQLKSIFMAVLDSRLASALAKKIVRQRETRPFARVGDFLEVCKFLPTTKRHPATNAFLAIRIAVNSELENIKDALPQAVDLLSPGGRVLVITFHSVEDSLVKDIFNKMEKQHLGKVIQKTGIVPTDEEVARNAKSRSARLRIFEKI